MHTDDLDAAVISVLLLPTLTYEKHLKFSSFFIINHNFIVHKSKIHLSVMPEANLNHVWKRKLPCIVTIGLYILDQMEQLSE